MNTLRQCGRLIFLLAISLLCTRSTAAPPPSTVPVEGIRRNTPNVHALVGAKIVVAPGRTIEAGTIVVRDGVIEAAGAGVEVPPDARLWKLDGKTVYPGLIDAYSPVSVSAPSDRGATYWHSLIQPESDVAQRYRADSGLDASFRSQGITCRLAVPDYGVIKGTAALVATGDDHRRRALIADRVALLMRLTVDSRRDKAYPRSPMGAVALARQAFCDADWYGRAWGTYRADPSLPRPERNDSLAVLGEYLGADRLVIVDASDEQYLLRADAFAREFALKIAVRGSGREYRRLDAVKQTGRTVIVPLAFPKAPEVGSAEAALDVSLGDLMHWDIAPENPARLAAAGVRICLTSDGLPSRKEFLSAVRKAVKHGLEPDAALAAMTTEPAALLGVDDRLGTIETGKLAHLVVTDGDLLAKDTRVLETWVDGRRYEIEKAPLYDLRGTWRIEPDTRRAKPMILTLSGKPLKLEGTVRFDRKKVEAAKLKSASLSDARFHATFDGDPLGIEGIVQLSAVISAGPPDERPGWLGSVRRPDGSSMAVKVVPIDAEPDEDESEGKNDESNDENEPKSDEPDESKPAADPSASFAVNYPLGAFGREAPPEQHELAAFTGATVWTCDDRGVMEDATLLVAGSKILAVGHDVDVPRGAVRIDCRGKHISAGVIDCHSHLATDGGGNESGQAISAEVRIGDFIDATQINIYRQLAGGVTSSLILHGSSNPIGGQNQMIKLRWGALPEELKFVEAPGTLKMALGENVKQSNWGDEHTTRYPQTRMGVEQIIRDAMEAARQYELRWTEWRRSRRGLPPRRDLELEPLVEVLHEKRWVHCHAYRQDEVLAVLRTFEDFNVRLGVLIHILEGYKVADEIARHGAMATSFSDWWAYKFEVYDAIPYNGALMHAAGVVVSFNSDDRELARHLNQEAAKAVRYGGIAPEEAIKFVTLNPARQLRIDQYVGSLAPGKHADLVVWSGPPLSNFSKCEQTWIDGRKYFDVKEDLAARAEAKRRHAALVQKVLGAAEQDRKSEEKKETD